MLDTALSTLFLWICWASWSLGWVFFVFGERPLSLKIAWMNTLVMAVSSIAVRWAQRVRPAVLFSAGIAFLLLPNVYVAASQFPGATAAAFDACGFVSSALGAVALWCLPAEPKWSRRPFLLAVGLACAGASFGLVAVRYTAVLTGLAGVLFLVLLWGALRTGARAIAALVATAVGAAGVGLAGYLIAARVRDRVAHAPPALLSQLHSQFREFGNFQVRAVSGRRDVSGCSSAGMWVVRFEREGAWRVAYCHSNAKLLFAERMVGGS
ncbi:MAG: hypothetical protein HYV09_12790 [Deltaproteobacteria bacterium]|nr:hypothetical protein [Deltaproteobacteria bacterium]